MFHYENTPIQIYWKLHQKLKVFRLKNSDIFHISAQNIDCGYLLEPPRRGGSNKYPQSMYLSRNKTNNVYPCKPQFYYIKVGFKGVKTIYVRLHDVNILLFLSLNLNKFILLLEYFKFEVFKDYS